LEDIPARLTDMLTKSVNTKRRNKRSQGESQSEHDDIVFHEEDPRNEAFDESIFLDDMEEDEF
jgi:hypothetical protein